ncbi:DUF4167 domain-containing protein [Sphingomicrobium lutaoense]|uniref:DUF4167 domain-containing protein n=1 Tax=Sphingomicrobium lutaoense TaxID=515949 RepID=A0A839YXH1_9SPHN|nr:DUF4167 domain-containing protein [Sphingomicrobium lutaoense]MBB3764891.1 hypothetical protein [Sphingomicrobium lutaoense]
MINNRQSRRRGRGGQPNRGGPRGDNRQRGNAAQLLEKYKGLARDAQMSGDRVQAEYYLQFADHYFRVLEDHKAKQEDQQPPRQKGRRQDSDAEDGEGENKAEGETKPKSRRRASEDNVEAKPKPRRRTVRKDEDDGDAGEANAIAADALPPAIKADDSGEEAPKPRRTRRKPSDDGDTASAA